jgi:5-methylcytosine-specific restriction endonuclease McrA
LGDIVGKFTLGGLKKQMKQCLFCGEGFIPCLRARQTRLYCSTKCRRAFDSERQKAKYRKSKTCLSCYQVYSWTAYTKYCSSQCRNKAQKLRNKNKKTMSLCIICNKASVGSLGYSRKYCSKLCKHKGMFGGKPPLEERTRKAQRNFRERNVAGLTRHEMSILRLQWISQGQSCTYCDLACETVDHIVPLNRGGDNQKQNLTPACRSCNSSKGARLLSEWKLYDRRKAKKTNRAKTLVG